MGMPMLTLIEPRQRNLQLQLRPEDGRVRANAACNTSEGVYYVALRSPPLIGWSQTARDERLRF
jgi:hypothetical protein